MAGRTHRKRASAPEPTASGHLHNLPDSRAEELISDGLMSELTDEQHA